MNLRSSEILVITVSRATHQPMLYVWQEQGPTSVVFLLGLGGYLLPHTNLVHPNCHLVFWLLQHPFSIIQINAPLFSLKETHQDPTNCPSGLGGAGMGK